MKLEKFDTNKKKKNFVIAGIAVVLIALVGIVFYKSYALYKVEKSYNVLQGKVGQFVTGDIEFAVVVDGVTTTTIPAKGAYAVTVTCDNGATGTWDSDKWGALITNMSTSKTKCSLTFTTQSFAGYLMALSQTDSRIKAVSHGATNQTTALTAYRFVGTYTDVNNNYVCFGSTATTCPSDNLYRIIGVIPTQTTSGGSYTNLVKLFKEGSYTETTSGYLTNSAPNGNAKVGYLWNKNSENDIWAGSPINYKVLNEVYWGSLGSTWQAYIKKNVVWYTGAKASNIASSSGHTGSYFYSQERGTLTAYDGGSKYYVGTIGLVYPSDIGYSIDSCVNGDLRTKCGDTWFGGTLKYMWTITSTSEDYNVYYWTTSAGIATTHPKTGVAFTVHPTFYLNADVYKTGGTGTKDDPYRLGI